MPMTFSRPPYWCGLELELAYAVVPEGADARRDVAAGAVDIAVRAGHSDLRELEARGPPIAAQRELHPAIVDGL
jgi:hypothetical protein